MNCQTNKQTKNLPSEYGFSFDISVTFYLETLDAIVDVFPITRIILALFRRDSFNKNICL